MTDSTSRLCDELAVFSDLGTDPPRAMRHGNRLDVRMIRSGDELRLEFLNGPDGKVIEHPANGAGSRTHASYKALLASESFSDLRLWADHQKTVLRGRLKNVERRIHVEGALSGTADTLDIDALDDRFVPGICSDPSIRVMLIDGPAGIGKTRFIESLAASRADRFLTTRRPLVLHVQSRGRVLTFLQDLIAFSLQTVAGDRDFRSASRAGAPRTRDPCHRRFRRTRGSERVRPRVGSGERSRSLQIRGKGTLILAGRETFIGRERVSKKITSLRQHDLYSKHVVPAAARSERRQGLGCEPRHWSDERH